LERVFGEGAGMFDSAAPPDAHGLTVLPFWAGERSPGWHDDSRATILGLTLNTSRTDIARASLESAVFQLAAIDDRLCTLTATPPAIFGAGGMLAASPGLAQLTADVLGRPITLCADAQASARGTALLALDISVPPRITRVYPPRPAYVAQYRIARERQARAYERIIGEGLLGGSLD
jgi:gluconokinase